MEDIFRLPKGTELTAELLDKFLVENFKKTALRYIKLEKAYRNEYEIFSLPKKESWKPDNRIAVNFAKYITDTMNGFFIGIPIKISSDDEKVKEYAEFLDAYNNQDDQNAELSKICSMFGKGYEMYYVDENANIGITYLKPTEAFMIYDDSIVKNRMYFVRYYFDAENVLHGSVSDSRVIKYFTRNPSVKYDGEERLHGFDGVPAVEYVENEERIGLYEGAMSQINAYNKALSEKANDVDYFADAYLKILGQRLDEKSAKCIRSNRIINFDGQGADKLVVEFLQKPNADETQENLINRLEQKIFASSMVANISDENFGTQSGIALKYKLLCMRNLAKTKERKFTAGLNLRYKLIFSNPVSGMNKDDWMKLKFTFTPNYPANLADEAEIAEKLSGVTSKETQLSVLSVVEDVDGELERIEKENDSAGYMTDFPTDRTVTNE